MDNCTSDIEQIVRAMTEGVFDCGHCEFSKITAYRPDEYVLCDKISLQGGFKALGHWPCKRWKKQG